MDTFIRGRTLPGTFFMSLSMANSLRLRNTTILGIMQLNRRERPHGRKIMKGQETFQTKVMVSESGCTLTMYIAKPKEIVWIQSSLHKNVTKAKEDDYHN
jgi:hypothetical protein